MTVRRKILLVFAGLAILIVLAGGAFTGLAVYYRMERAPNVPRGKETYLEAITLAEQGRAERALEVARSIEFDVHGDYSRIAIEEVVQILAQNGQAAVVLEFAQNMTDKVEADSFIIALAEWQAEIGQTETALVTIEIIPIRLDRYVAKIRVAAIVARQGDTARALVIARNIPERDGKLGALHAVARILGEQNQKVLAKEIVDEAIIIARSIGKTDSMHWKLASSASILAELGYFEDALKLSTALPEGTPRSTGLRDIAESLADAGQIESARETVGLMGDEEGRIFAFGRIMITQLATGEIENALKTAEFQPAGPKRDRLLGIVSERILHEYWPEPPVFDISDSSLAIASAMEGGEMKDIAFMCIAGYAAKSADIATMVQALVEIEDARIRKKAYPLSFFGLLYGRDFCAPIS